LLSWIPGKTKDRCRSTSSFLLEQLCRGINIILFKILDILIGEQEKGYKGSPVLEEALGQEYVCVCSHKSNRGYERLGKGRMWISLKTKQ